MTPREALLQLQQLFWPLEDPDRPWTPDTLESAADILGNAGYGRRVASPDALCGCEHARARHSDADGGCMVVEDARCDCRWFHGACMDNAKPYTSDGALGHGFECGVCGKFLQAG